jgi:ubiquinol-cytochrome c reductase cytochrome c subunit
VRRVVPILLVAAAVGAAPAAAAVPTAPPPQGTLAAKGYALYGRYCIVCHGSAGAGISRPVEAGGGPLREQSVQGAVGPSLRGVGALAADFYLRTGYMPLKRIGPQPRRSRVLFSEEQIRALTAYVASLAPGPAIPRPHPERGNIAAGLHLFTDRCAGCHQVVAQGGYVTDAVAPPLENATATQIAEAVRIGPYIMPRFSEKDISPSELDSIVRYVQYAAKSPSQRGGWGIGFLGPVPEGLVTWFIAAAVLVGVCILIGRRLKEE